MTSAAADSSDDTSSEEDFKTGLEGAQMGQGMRVTLDDQQMNTAQKLLLFWRKPAVSLFPITLYLDTVRRRNADPLILGAL